MSTYVKPYDRRSRPRRVISNTGLVIAVACCSCPCCGASVPKAVAIADACDLARPPTLQQQYDPLAARERVGGHPFLSGTRPGYPAVVAVGRFLAVEVVSGGRSASPAQVALSWLAERPAVTTCPSEPAGQPPDKRPGPGWV